MAITQAMCTSYRQEVMQGVVIKNAACPKDGNSHQVRIQTDDLTAGFYTLRVDTVDSADGFKDTIYNEKIEFIK